MTFEQQIVLVLIGGGIGLVSAVVGGLVSYFLQRRVEKDRREYERQVERDRRKYEQEEKERNERKRVLTVGVEESNIIVGGNIIGGGSKGNWADPDEPHDDDLSGFSDPENPEATP